MVAPPFHIIENMLDDMDFSKYKRRENKQKRKNNVSVAKQVCKYNPKKLSRWIHRLKRAQKKTPWPVPL